MITLILSALLAALHGVQAPPVAPAPPQQRVGPSTVVPPPFVPTAGAQPAAGGTKPGTMPPPYIEGASQFLVQPGQTWQHILADVKPGDEIIFPAGFHVAQVIDGLQGTREKPIFIRSRDRVPAAVACDGDGWVFRRPKHVVVEKPLALTLASADRMIEACDRAGVKLFVVKQNRFNVPVVKMREAYEAGRFGKLVLGTVRVRWCRPQSYYDLDAWRGTWALDGGVLTNQASHHIDLLEWMMGSVESVFAMSTTALVDVETEDTAVVVLRFASGALGVIEATTAARPKDLEGSISLLGESGTVVIGGFAVNEMKVWNFVEPQPEDENVLADYSVNPPNVYGFGHQAYYDHVVMSVTLGTPPLVDGLAGRQSVELITAIYESIETRREVFLRDAPKSFRLGKRDG